MPRHLTRMAIDKVSLVDNGANDRRFAVLKQAAPVDAPPEDEPQSMLQRVADALGLGDRVAKTETFGEVVAERDMREAIDEGLRILNDVVTSAQWGYTEDGTEMTMAQKREVVATSIDQFRAFVLDAMNDDIEKAGRKIAASRLSQIKEAFRVLGEVISGVEDGYWSPPEDAVSKEADMTADEIRALVEKSVADQFTALTAEEGALSKAIVTAVQTGVTEGVAKAAPEPAPEKEPEDGGVTLSHLTSAVAKLADRMNGYDGERSSRQSSEGADDTPVAKKASAWAGILD